MSRPRILIAIPSLTSRAPYLVNAIRGFAERTPKSVEWKIEVVYDADGAGAGWNLAAERGLAHFDAQYIHFSNDDIVPATGWVEPLIEACDAGCVPCVRIEPAGGHIRDQQIFQTHPPMPPDYYPVPRDPMSYFYSDIPERQPQTDWEEIVSGNLPTCSREAWEKIGVFPPLHYFTDHFFYHRARQLGYKVVARLDSVFFNFNSPCGRHRTIDGVDWNEQTALDYEGVFALPKYISGELKPTEVDPLRCTEEGRVMAAEWRQRTFG